MRLPFQQCLLVTAAAFGILSADAFAQSAQAAFITFSSRASFDALGPYVGVDWGVFGPAGTTISTPDSRSVGGITVSVASSQGTLDRRDEGTDFTGTFTIGDRLLTDSDSESDSFLINFASPVQGFGTQIDAHFIAGAYTGGIEVLDASNILLDTILFAGTNTGAEDNSAPFVGVLSDLANISHLRFFIDQTDPNIPAKSGALAINRLDVLTSVPEPATLALFGMGVLLASGFRKSGRRRAAQG